MHLSEDVFLASTQEMIGVPLPKCRLTLENGRLTLERYLPGFIVGTYKNSLEIIWSIYVYQIIDMRVDGTLNKRLVLRIESPAAGGTTVKDVRFKVGDPQKLIDAIRSEQQSSVNPAEVSAKPTIPEPAGSPQVRYCGNCGKPNPMGSLFCNYCGKPLPPV